METRRFRLGVPFPLRIYTRKIAFDETSTGLNPFPSNSARRDGERDSGFDTRESK